MNYKYEILLFVGDYKQRLSDSMFSLMVHNFMVDFWGEVDKKFPYGPLSVSSDYDPPYLKMLIVTEFAASQEEIDKVYQAATASIHSSYQNLSKAFSTVLTSITFRRP